MHTNHLKCWIAASIVSVAAVLSTHPVVASPRLLSLAFNSQISSPQQIAADEFRSKLPASASKRIAIDQRGSNALGSENVIFAAIRAGSLDIAVLSGSVVASAVPELSVFDIPFLFRDAAHAKAVAQGPIGASIAAKFADKGLTLLAIGRQGFRNVTNSKRPIRTPDDLKGLKIRVIPNEVYQMTFKALGADVMPMEFPLVYNALKDGRLDGQENPVQTISSARLYEVQKYLTLSGHFFAPVIIVANRAMFEQLAPEDRATLLAMAKDGAEATWQAKQDAVSLEQLRAAGMDVVDKFERQPFVDAVKPLDAEFEKRFGKSILAAIRSTQ
jgi:tripartite ATP-independent transporter DctP family solute receptor